MYYIEHKQSRKRVIFFNSQFFVNNYWKRHNPGARGSHIYICIYKKNKFEY